MSQDEPKTGLRLVKVYPPDTTFERVLEDYPDAKGTKVDGDGNVTPFFGTQADDIAHVGVPERRFADQIVHAPPNWLDDEKSFSAHALLQQNNIAKRQQCHEQTIGFMNALANLADSDIGAERFARFGDYQLGHCFCETSADGRHHVCCKCGEAVFMHPDTDSGE